MPKTNNITHAGRRATVHRAARRHTAASGHRIEQGLEKATRLVLGTRRRAPMRQQALAGVAVLAAAAIVTAGVVQRRMLARAAGVAAKRTSRLGRSVALATGLRRRARYGRVLPGIGVAVGVLAASSALYVLVPRMRGRAEGEPETQRPSYGPPSDLNTPADPGGAHDRG